MASSFIPAPFLPYLRFVRSARWFITGSFLLLIIPVSLHAQQAKAPIASGVKAPSAAVPPDLSKEAYVLDKVHSSIREEADGTGVRENTIQVRILADAGVKEFAVLSFTYTAASETVEIPYIRVHKADGSVVTTPDYNIQDMPAAVTRSAPMYSDYHEKHVAVKALGVGDTLEYKVVFRKTKPEVPNHFWLEYNFTKGSIVLDEQIELDVPENKFVSVVSSDVQPKITTDSGRKHYVWKSSSLTRPDDDAPPVSIKKQKPSIQISTFATWKEVGAWYRSLEQDPVKVTPAVRAKAEQLTAGLSSDEDKIRAISNYVALHIHYVGISFGIGRYQPHVAEDVLSNEYGDCKDKHTLLAAMLHAVGIEAWPVLISNFSELDPAVPSPGQFNHVVTLIPQHGRMLWMDTTEEVAPVGVLMSTLRDKQALAIPLSKDAYLEKTPENLPYPSHIEMTVEGKLSAEGTLTAHFASSYYGDTELLLRYSFRNIPKANWKEAVQGISSASGYAGEVSNVIASAPDELGTPFTIAYDYHREKYGDWDNRRITPPLPPFGVELPPGVKNTKPADEPELGSPGEVIYRSKIELPRGWQITASPSVDLVEDWAEYHSSYSIKNGIFQAERKFVVKKDKVPFQDWEKYSAFRRALYEDESKFSLLLNESLAEAKMNEFQMVADKLRSASMLLADSEHSSADLQKADTLAREALSKIKAVLPTLPKKATPSLSWSEVLSFSWSTIGWAALESKDYVTAASYLQAAWRLSQDQLTGYHLAQMLEANGNKEEAAKTYLLAGSASSYSFMFALGLPNYANLSVQITNSYERVTGKSMVGQTVKQTNGRMVSPGEYMNNLLEKKVSAVSKVNGGGLFVLAFEDGKLADVTFLGGDAGVQRMTTILRSTPLRIEMPAGERGLVLREGNLVCSVYAGCDLYVLRMNSIQNPPISISAGSKTIEIELKPDP